MQFLPFDLSVNPEPEFLRPEILRQSQLPKMLHTLNPRTILGQTWWNKTRQEAYATNGQCCWACGAYRGVMKGGRQQLEAHESYAIDYQAGQAALLEVQAICPTCHGFIHMGRTWSLWRKEEISTDRYVEIAYHGYCILASAGLLPWDHTRELFEPDFIASPEGRIAPWGQWRMVIGNVEYPPKFKNYEEWKEYHGH